ncbi:MAG: hypothetical protein JNM72_02920 [Deltaproteobacteria bacterium]|nr:hypothetical protein [Deltaproteobacteria bacterium]
MSVSPRWPDAAAAAIVVGAALLFAPSLGADFVWDDRPLILDDTRLRTLRGVVDAISGDFFDWASDAQAYGYWRPLVTLTYAAQRAVHGPLAWAYHLFNIALHCIVMVLGYAWGKQRGLNPWGLCLGLALFAVMPSHVEAVTWVAGRTDLLAAAAVLATLLVDGSAQPRRHLFVAPLLLAAVMSKELAVVTPVLALLLNGGRLTAGRAAAFALPLLLWAVVRSTIVAVRPSVGPPDSVGEWLLTVPAAVELYLRGLTGLSAPLAYRSLPPVDGLSRPALWSGLTLLLGGLAAGLRWPSFGKWALAGLLCLAPALNVIRVAAPLDMGFPVSDRFAYLPSLLWALGLGALLVDLFGEGRRRLALGLLAPAGLAMAAVLVSAQAAWVDDATFFSATNARNPGRPLVEIQMVEALRRAGRLEDAQAAGEIIARRHVDAGEDMPGALRLTLLAVASVGQPPTTVQRMWREHVKAIPEPNALDWLNLGMAEDRAGDWAAAELAFLEAVRDRPEFLAAWVGLGLVRVKRDNLLGARAALDQGRVIDPAHPGLQQLEDLINAAEKR